MAAGDNMLLDKYLDIPFLHMGRDEEGLDCVGLTYLWYKNERGLALPLPEELGYQYSKDYENEPEHPKDNLLRLLMMWGRLRMAPDQGDIAVFGLNRPTHCGIYISNGRFLSADRKVGKVVVDDMNNDWFPYYLGTIKVDDILWAA